MNTVSDMAKTIAQLLVGSALAVALAVGSCFVLDAGQAHAVNEASATFQTAVEE